MNVLIVYETQNGSTQYVSEIMQKFFQDRGFQVTLHSIKAKGMEPDYASADLILFGAPTYDDGLLEVTMREFITKNAPDLSQKKVAVFGLGNRNYPQFCYSADILTDWVKQNKGIPFIDSLKIDGFPDNLEPILTWSNLVSEKLE